MFAEKIDIPLPTAEGLIDNTIRFSNLLRDNGISVSPPAVIDTLKGLPLIDISILQEFKVLLQANLICRKKDIAKFNQLFHGYWLPQKRVEQDILSKESVNPAEEQNTTESRNLDNTNDTRSSQQPEPKSAQQGALCYSPKSLLKNVAGQELQFLDSRLLYEAICRLLKPLNNRLSRRFKYSVRGKKISLRRILRKNMQFGGELIFLDFKKKKAKKRRVLFFCDVSGSMDIYTRMILQFVHALKCFDRRTEIFFFSTELSRATFDFIESNVTSAISGIPQLTANWGGGTRIGHCLRTYNESYGRRMLSTKDIVIIFSDGWDRGEIEVLETQMALLKRKTYKIIWLNPLKGTVGYQPICRGMRTALPYVDFFLPMESPRDLALLARMLVKIIA
jgi:uncharacterized protein with von Willebrand factor type A (vWA) domain